MSAGAGAIISQGVMRQGELGRVERYLVDLPWHSGDAMLTETMWNVLGVAPTDPGAGPCMQIACHLAVTMWAAKVL